MGTGRHLDLGCLLKQLVGPVETACQRSLELDVVSASKIASMLEKATDREQPLLPATAGSPGGRFARDPSEYSGRATPNPGSVQLTLIPGGADASVTADHNTGKEPTR